MSGIGILNAFGDTGLLLSLAAALLAWLFSTRPHAALWLGVAVVMCGGATAISKIYLHACPITPVLRGPSGHVSFATLIYGALVAVIAPRAPAWARWPLAVAGGTLVVAIAVGRYVIDAHTVAEILLGLGIGLVALAIFVLGYWHGGAGARSVKPLALAAAAIAIVAYGHPFNGEVFVNALGFGGETEHLTVAAACPAEYGQKPAPPAGGRAGRLARSGFGPAALSIAKHRRIGP
ncbi:MAG TPA: phosphatase PAP2 family protein [Stellaceae bacterium]|jgi:hypothetical protein